MRPRHPGPPQPPQHQLVPIGRDVGQRPGHPAGWCKGEQGREAATLCALNILSHLANATGDDPSKVVTAVRLAGVVNCGLALFIGKQLPAADSLVPILLVGFLGYGVSLVMFVLALRGLGSARTGAYFSTAPR